MLGVKSSPLSSGCEEDWHWKTEGSSGAGLVEFWALPVPICEAQDIYRFGV